MLAFLLEQCPFALLPTGCIGCASPEPHCQTRIAVCCCSLLSHVVLQQLMGRLCACVGLRVDLCVDWVDVYFYCWRRATPQASKRMAADGTHDEQESQTRTARPSFCFYRYCRPLVSLHAFCTYPATDRPGVCVLFDPSGLNTRFYTLQCLSALILIYTCMHQTVYITCIFI